MLHDNQTYLRISKLYYWLELILITFFVFSDRIRKDFAEEHVR